MPDQVRHDGCFLCSRTHSNVCVDREVRVLLSVPKGVEPRSLIRALFLPLLLALAACATAPPAPAPLAAAPERRAPITILVSIDGFRPDYLDRSITPNLNALAAQ